MHISVVVLTKNEETTIADCLASLTWCSERVVIDDVSTDKTTSVAKAHGAVVFSRPLNGDFAMQRNFSLEKAKSDWVLFLDADERISPELQKEIEGIIREETAANGFYLKRLDSMWGKELRHGEQGNIKLLRLARRNAGQWIGKVHEVWNVKGSTGLLQNPLYHFPHPTLADFLHEINTYSTIRAEELHQKGVRSSWWSVLLYAKGKFFQDYVVKMGFLDGIEGFIVAILMSLHAFLVRGKLWQLNEH